MVLSQHGVMYSQGSTMVRHRPLHVYSHQSHLCSTTDDIDDIVKYSCDLQLAYKVVYLISCEKYGLFLKYPYPEFPNQI